LHGLSVDKLQAQAVWENASNEVHEMGITLWIKMPRRSGHSHAHTVKNVTAFNPAGRSWGTLGSPEWRQRPWLRRKRMAAGEGSLKPCTEGAKVQGPALLLVSVPWESVQRR